MDPSPMDAFQGELLQTSPSLDYLLAEDSPLSTVDTIGTGVTSNTESSGTDITNGTPGWGETVNLENLMSEKALESIGMQRSQNKLIHLDPIPNFQDRNEIKPWLQKIFYPQGIEIVIERSDNIKVVFKCKASRRGKTSRRRNGCGPIAEEKENPESPLAVQRVQQQSCKKKRSVSPYNTCPFRVRATYSLKRKKWNIVVMNNGHSHPLKFNADSDDYKKFKNYLREHEDWEAVKKFDELECRTRFNLPIEPQPIPCDCGLTQEIESFNIVLPTSDSMANSTDKTVSKPRHKSSRKSNSHIATALSRHPTPLEVLGRSSPQLAQAGTEPQSIKVETPTHNSESNVMGMQSVQAFDASLSALDASLSTWEPNALPNQSEEIDFTDLFLNPLTRMKHEPMTGSSRELPWTATTKQFMDEFQFPLSPAPVCEINHTDHCNCLMPSSTDGLGRDSPHEFHQRIQQQGRMESRSSPAGAVLTADLNNLHLTGQQHMQTSNLDQGVAWNHQHNDDPHEYSNDFLP